MIEAAASKTPIQIGDAEKVVSELTEVRRAYVDAYVTRRVDHREGDVTHEQIDAWQLEAINQWNADHPALVTFWRAFEAAEEASA